jgi:hypothetical protein
MAFIFNSNDIQRSATSKSLAFGGDYLVKIKQADYYGKETVKSLKTYGSEKFRVVFEVLDGTQQGATFSHFFLDDSGVKEYTPFRYREINAMLAGIGGIQDGVSFELANVGQFLPEKILAVRVEEFKKRVLDNGNTVYNPVVSNFGEPIQKSVPNENNPRPKMEKKEDKEITLDDTPDFNDLTNPFN